MTDERVYEPLPAGRLENGVLLLEPPSAFEAAYSLVRKAERRVLTDEQVRSLPNGDGLWNAAEWDIRTRSAKRLVKALSELDRPLTILDVGCGNGWLSALLQREGHTVHGMDAFTEELEQAARIFPGPQFMRADLFRSPLPERAFDAIIFAASFQYFPYPVATIQRCMELLTAHGEVHILDSMLYRSKAECVAAVERSRTYYGTLGFPEMASHYHAHELAQLQALGKLRVLSAPNGMERTLKRFGRPSSPFTHVVIER